MSVLVSSLNASLLLPRQVTGKSGPSALILRRHISLTTSIIMQYTASIMILTQNFVQCQWITCNFKYKNAILTAERRCSILQILRRKGKMLASERRGIDERAGTSEGPLRRHITSS